jgi:hypothetical protein
VPTLVFAAVVSVVSLAFGILRRSRDGRIIDRALREGGRGGSDGPAEDVSAVIRSAISRSPHARSARACW